MIRRGEEARCVAAFAELMVLERKLLGWKGCDSERSVSDVYRSVTGKGAGEIAAKTKCFRSQES